jgi:hypothetical protein
MATGRSLGASGETRRNLLFGAFGGLSSAPSAVSAGANPSNSLEWDNLWYQLLPMAKRLTSARNPREASYLARLASELAKLRSAPAAKFRPGIPVAQAIYRNCNPLIPRTA